jgi:hypothetical protein
MPSPEESRQRAKEASNQANASRNEWKRQGLLIIADQYERLAAYKNLTASPYRVTAPAKARRGVDDSRSPVVAKIKASVEFKPLLLAFSARAQTDTSRRLCSFRDRDH